MRQILAAAAESEVGSPVAEAGAMAEIVEEDAEHEGSGPVERVFSLIRPPRMRRMRGQRNVSFVPMKVREVVRLLERHGWREVRSKGSHRQFKHPHLPDVITVPGTDGIELSPGTLNAILKKAGLK